jgi:head-tail adaptor
MPDKYTIASLNRMITIQHITIGKNDKGLPVKFISSQQSTYADFQQVSNKNFVINGIVPVEEGGLQWVVIRCAINNKSNTYEIMQPKREIHVKGNVTIGNKNYAFYSGVIMVFRDGIEYNVKRDGSASGKEINYNVNNGTFTYPTDIDPLQDDEATNIYFL